ncbi:hypothetical protein ACEQ8H_007249 [Pleosporales sp. CAS-2024a]
MPAAYHAALDDPNAWVPYRYHPSNVAAITFVVAFGLTTLLHLFQLVRKKTWYFIPLVVGGTFESVGYGVRCVSHEDLWALWAFLIQGILILIAPAIFAASIYIILGRIILLVDGERYSMVRLKWLTKMFVAGDIFSFVLQGAGGGIEAGGTLAALHTGEKLIVAGLFTQLFSFAFFVVVAADFHHRLVHDRPVHKQLGHPRLAVPSSYYAGPATVPRTTLAELPWQRHLYNLYLTSGLIVIRNIFRVIEHIQGNAGYLLSREYYLYVFDAVLMLAIMLLFNWRHPSEITQAYKRRTIRGDSAELQHLGDKDTGRETTGEKAAGTAHSACVQDAVV